MKTKFDIEDKVYFIKAPENLDLKELIRINIFSGTISEIYIDKRKISYKIFADPNNKPIITEGFINKDQTELLHSFFQDVIKIKESEIDRIKQFLLKKVVNLKDIQLWGVAPYLVV